MPHSFRGSGKKIERGSSFASNKIITITTIRTKTSFNSESTVNGIDWHPASLSELLFAKMNTQRAFVLVESRLQKKAHDDFILSLKRPNRTSRPGHPAKHSPEAAAKNHVPESHLEVLSRKMKRPPEEWTIHEFLREVAGLGGFLKRKHDGEPGWQIIWSGWQYLIQLTEGYQLTKPPP